MAIDADRMMIIFCCCVSLPCRSAVELPNNAFYSQRFLKEVGWRHRGRRFGSRRDMIDAWPRSLGSFASTSKTNSDVSDFIEILGLMDPSCVYEVWESHVCFEIFRSELRELVPFCHDDAAVCSLDVCARVFCVLDSVREDPPCVRDCHGIIGDDLGAFLSQTVYYPYRGGFSGIVC